MDNQESFSIIIEMLKQLNYSVLTLSQNQSLIYEQYKLLDKKIDDKIDALEKNFNSKIDALEKKFDNKIDALEKKVDSNLTNFIKIQDTITKIQKDIVDLREDINTIYDLERNSCKHLI